MRLTCFGLSVSNATSLVPLPVRPTAFRPFEDDVLLPP
jgi:hypothetical protein